MSGGFNGYDSVASKPERLELLRKAIAEVDADILGLTDTFRWKDSFSQQELIEAFGYQYSFHIDMNDTRVDKRIGVAILSRIQLKACAQVRLHNRNAIKASVLIPGTDEVVQIFVVYLDDLSELTRMEEVRTLVETTERGVATVVIGDFNALWPEHVADVKHSMEQFFTNTTHRKAGEDYATSLKPTLENLYQAETLPSLKAAGFSEPTNRALKTALTKLHPLNMSEAAFPVDHILTKDCRSKGYRVYDEPLFEEASDHYPLSAIIEL